jgi:hypothetical protein
MPDCPLFGFVPPNFNIASAQRGTALGFTNERGLPGRGRRLAQLNYIRWMHIELSCSKGARCLRKIYAGIMSR